MISVRYTDAVWKPYFQIFSSAVRLYFNLMKNRIVYLLFLTSKLGHFHFLLLKTYIYIFFVCLQYNLFPLLY